MPMKRIALRLEGTGTSGNVSLDDFVAELGALKASLEQADRALTGGRRSVEWEVVDLRHSSPATIVLEGRPIEDEPWATEARAEFLDEFLDATRRLQQDEDLPSRYSPAFLSAVRSLAAPVGAGRVKATVIVADEELPVTPAMGTSAIRQLESELESQGRYKGLLEFLNIHGRKSEFRIYPPAGPNFVTCEFAPSLLPEAQTAVGRNVMVDGTLVYRGRSAFPHRIKVSRIGVAPPNSELPTLKALRGLVPDLTSGRPAELWVREVRDSG